MSVEMMAMVWRSELPAEEKFVALAVADHADPDGRNIYPSQATIARMVGKTDRAVRRSLRKLEARRILVVDSWPDDGRYHPTIRYRLDPEQLAPPDVTSAPPDESSEAPPEVASPPPPHPTSDPPDATSGTPGRQCPDPPDAGVRRSVRDPEEEEEEQQRSRSSSSFDPDASANKEGPVCPEHGIPGFAGTPRGTFWHIATGGGTHTFVPQDLAGAGPDPYAHVYRRGI